MRHPTLLALASAKRSIDEIESPSAEVQAVIDAIDSAASIELSLESRVAQAEAAVETWNRLYPVGSEVIIVRHDGKTASSSTKGDARTISDGKMAAVPVALYGMHLLGTVFPVPPPSEPA